MRRKAGSAAGQRTNHERQPKAREHNRVTRNIAARRIATRSVGYLNAGYRQLGRIAQQPYGTHPWN